MQFFALQTTLHSWLGIIIVLTTTYCYMNIAIGLQTTVVQPKTTPEKVRTLPFGGCSLRQRYMPFT